MHPLRRALEAAATGSFPAIDGRAEVHDPDDAGTHAVVEFTGHSFVLTDRPPDEVLARGADGFGGATQPDLLRWLAGPTGQIGSLDAVLVAAGTGEIADARRVVPRDDLDDHPRVARALAHRRDVRVFGDDQGLVTIGRGLVGRTELSVELYDGSAMARGAGRSLIQAGLGMVAAGSAVWAQVAPGNAASLRAFLACGFTPIGSEVLLHPAP